MKLVYVENNRPITDSLIVAESFGKEHKHVMRDIRELECSKEFRQSNFGLTPYTHEQNGQTYEKFLITYDGFSFLVMGYTGKDAARFKEKYINEFNSMRNQLLQHQIPQTRLEALEAYLLEMKKTAQLEAKIESDRPMVIFAESLQVSSDSILIGELAKLLKQNGIDVGGTRLHKRLRDDGYLMKHGEQYNMPTQRSMDLKIMEVKTGSINNPDKTIRITRTTKITGKGQIYFINKFRSIGQVGNEGA